MVKKKLLQTRIVNHPTVRKARAEQMSRVSGNDLGFLYLEILAARNAYPLGSRGHRAAQEILESLDRKERRGGVHGRG